MHTTLFANENTLGLVSILGGKYNDIEIKGQYAYVAVEAKLQVLDISDKQAPKKVFEYLIPKGANDIFIFKNYLYVAVREQGLYIFDITEPSKPIFKSMYEVNYGGVRHVVANGHYAYLYKDSKLFIIDIDDPVKPKKVSELQIDYSRMSNLEIKDNYLYLLSSEYDSGNGYLKIIDISDSKNPDIISNISVSASNTMAFMNNYLYLAGGGEIDTYDISDKSNPILKSTYNGRLNQYKDITIVGHFMYASTGIYKKLEILTLLIPDRPTRGSVLSLPESVENIVVSGDYLYIVAPDKGLLTIDASDLLKPKLIHTLKTLSNVRDIDVKDNFAYLAEDGEGMSIVNIEDQVNPILISSLYLPGMNQAIEVVGNYVYMASSGKMYIIDIADKNHPVKVSEFSFKGRGESIHIKGENAYILSSTSGLHIVNISNKTNPVEISNVPGSGYGSDLVILGDYAYVARYNRDSFQIINISNPSSPYVESKVDTYAQALAVQNNLLYVGDYNFKIYNIADKTTPVLEKEVKRMKVVTKMVIKDNFIYTSDFWRGDLNIIDVQNTSDPKLVKTYDIAGYACGIKIAGDYVYMASLNAGIAVIRIRNRDTDGDGIFDSVDLDDDNDGVPDVEDIFPLDVNESIDTDGDGIGNNADTDDDNDGIKDTQDDCPLDANESVDTDRDGIGNNADKDDDNDGISDSDEVSLGFNPLDASDGLSDSDGDGFSNAQEFDIGTDMNDTNDKPQWVPILMGDIMIFVPAKVQ